VLIGITTEGKVGLGGTALVLIGFALAASFLFPRRNPNFPGERLRSFIALSVVLFVAVIAAVVVFAAEEEEEGAAGGEATSTQVETGPTVGTTGTTTEAPSEGEGEGDPEAGEQVFADGGCGGCHALEAAGATGNIGPNLDEAEPDTELVVERVTNGMGTMPSFSGQFSEQEIQDVAAYVVQSTSG